MTYQGLRWLKCDLHMHNPLDNNWAGPRNGLTTEALADIFAEACHTANLDVIGLTSHSYAGLQFYPYQSMRSEK